MSDDKTFGVSSIINSLASLQTQYANDTETDVQTRTLKLSVLEDLAKKLGIEEEYAESIKDLTIILTRNEIEDVIGAIGMEMHEACSNELIRKYELLEDKIKAQLSNQSQE